MRGCIQFVFQLTLKGSDNKLLKRHTVRTCDLLTFAVDGIGQLGIGQLGDGRNVASAFSLSDSQWVTSRSAPAFPQSLANSQSDAYCG
jgi:hypothetical protein